MRSIVSVFLLALALAAGCTSPQYAKPNQDMAALEADFTDCYSDGALQANTPPYPDSPIAAGDKATDACMLTRGYEHHLRLF